MSGIPAVIFELFQCYIKQWCKLFPGLRNQTCKRLLDISDIEAIENVMVLNKYEDLVIIWCDNYLDEDIKNILDGFHSHIQLCSTIEQLIDYMDKIDRCNKIILIVSGQYSRDALQLFHEHEQIDSIFLYCRNEQLYQNLATKRQYPKLIGIFIHYQQLFNMLEKQIRAICKQISVFKLFDRNNRSIRYLEVQSVEYLWYQLLRNTLMQMETDSCKQKMLDYCRAYYQSDRVSLKAIDDFEQNYSSEKAITWYTKNFFPFNFINKTLRTEDVHALYKLRYFIIGLCNNIKLVFDEFQELYQELFEPLILYRGATFSAEDIDELKISKGKYVSTNGFLSTSRLRDVAETFASNVLFEIKIDPSTKTNTYAYVAYLSMVPDEEEVLFDLGALFQITNVKYERGKLFVSMNGVPDKNFLTNDYVEIQRSSRRQQNIRPLLSYGTYLIQMGHYGRSIEYFEDLVKNAATLTRFEQYVIFDYLAHAYSCNKQPDKALVYANWVLEKTIRPMKNLSEQEPHPLYSTYYCLKTVGVIYANKNEFGLALEYLEQAFSVAEANVDSLISLHQLLGHINFKQGNYIHALNHCRKSLKLIQKYRPQNSFIKAEVYETMGDIYDDTNIAALAVECLEKASAIRKSMFPHNHSDHGTIQLKLGSVYYKTKEVEKALKHCHNALEIFEKSSFNGIFDIIANLRAAFATLYMQKKIYTLAEEYYKKSLELHENKDATVHAYRGLALCYQYQGKIDLGVRHATLALQTQQLIKPIDEVETASLHRLIAGILVINHQYELALDHYNLSLSLMEQKADQGFSLLLACLYEDIGNVYLSINKKEFALEACNKALKIREKILPFNNTKLFILNFKMAKCYCEINEYILAIQHFGKAVAAAESINQLDAVVLLYTLISMTYSEQFENYKLAIKHQKMAVQTQRMIEPVDESKARCLLETVDHLYEQEHQYLHKLTKFSCNARYKHNLESDKLL